MTAWGARLIEEAGFRLRLRLQHLSDASRHARHTRNDLLAATKRDVAAIKERVERKRAPVHGKDKIGIAVGAVIGRHKMAKHFQIEIR